MAIENAKLVAVLPKKFNKDEVIAAIVSRCWPAISLAQRALEREGMPFTIPVICACIDLYDEETFYEADNPECAEVENALLRRIDEDFRDGVVVKVAHFNDWDWEEWIIEFKSKE